MISLKRTTAYAFAVFSLASASTQADVLAFTDFNDSTASGNTKSNLNWVLNGLEDPGDMSAETFGGANQNLFDSNAFVQDIFIPGLNVGNASGSNGSNVNNSSWITEVSITVAAGFIVTLTDVTLNSVSVSGGEEQNVNRLNDYTVTILDPSDIQVATATVADTLAGTTASPNQPLVTLDFADVVLGAGTYTLQIRGGDYTGTNETGNHTGLDNLSINGIVVPEPSAMALLALGGLTMLRRRRG